MKRITTIFLKFLGALVVSVLVYFIVLFVITNLYSFYLENKYPLNHRDIIEKYSSEYRLDPAFVSAVIYEESRFRPDSNSHKGAVGLMQILPETADYIAKKTQDLEFNKDNLGEVDQNIKYGCYYLSYLFDRYGEWGIVLAAYNAGEGNVDRWLEKEEYKIEFEETKNFVEKVQNTRNFYQSIYFGSK
uniref:Lytic transglycosylase domain-containing protein n=1 Tax=candidate division CPR3 bacterium TaxID=2268181 RepID=A0A7C4M1G0_UNCC3